MWARNAIAGRTSSRHLRFLLRTFAVQIALLYVYSASLRLQLIFFPRWHDQVVIDLEGRRPGVQPTVWIQRYITPWLTEWMMFCYVFYVPVYPILSFLIYRRHGEEQNEDYLFYIGLAIVLCTIGFMIFRWRARCATSATFTPCRSTAIFFTAVSELIRGRIHTREGRSPVFIAPPRPSCGWTAYRYSRPAFYVLAPVILSLYVSTVYGRFHYVFDVLAGIAAAFLTMALGPILIKAWNRFRLRC